MISLKRAARLLLPTVILCLLCACSSVGEGTVPTEATYQKITARQAKDIINSGEQYILLDVRTEEEHHESRLEGAVLIPDYEIAVLAEALLPDKDALILVYCRSGRRSALAAQELADKGYTNIYDFGGIIDWPYDTVSG